MPTVEATASPTMPTVEATASASMSTVEATASASMSTATPRMPWDGTGEEHRSQDDDNHHPLL
jgi:hypothetical protein